MQLRSVAEGNQRQSESRGVTSCEDHFDFQEVGKHCLAMGSMQEWLEQQVTGQGKPANTRERKRKTRRTTSASPPGTVHTENQEFGGRFQPKRITSPVNNKQNRYPTNTNNVRLSQTYTSIANVNKQKNHKKQFCPKKNPSAT